MVLIILIVIVILFTICIAVVLNQSGVPEIEEKLTDDVSVIEEEEKDEIKKENTI